MKCPHCQETIDHLIQHGNAHYTERYYFGEPAGPNQWRDTEYYQSDNGAYASECPACGNDVEESDLLPEVGKRN